MRRDQNCCCSLEIAFHDKVDKFSEYYDSVLKHLTKRTDEFFNQKKLGILEHDIREMTKLLVDIKTMQALCPLLKKADPYHPITPFLAALLNSLTLTTFYKDATAVVDLRASLDYFSDQHHKVSGHNLTLHQNYKRIQKRTQRAHTKLPFWSIFSSETRADRAMVHMAPQGV